MGRADWRRGCNEGDEGFEGFHGHLIYGGREYGLISSLGRTKGMMEAN